MGKRGSLPRKGKNLIFKRDEIKRRKSATRGDLPEEKGVSAKV